MKELISVIVTVDNDYKYLKDCLFSIVGQTYRNFEMVVVDNGCTDKSASVINELIITSSRTRVVRQFHTNLSIARQKGLEASRGKYVTFVNGQDKLDKDFLENLYQMVSTYNVDLAICPTYSNKHIHNSEKIITLDKEDALRQLLLEDSILNTPCGMLFSTKLFRDSVFSEDNVVEEVYKLFDMADKIAFMNYDCYFLRKKPDYPLNMVLEKDLKYMKLYSDLNIYCKNDIIKKILRHLYFSYTNNEQIDNESQLYDTFKKVVSEDGNKISQFLTDIQKAHMYLASNDLQNYKILCPVLPDPNL